VVALDKRRDSAEYECLNSMQLDHRSRGSVSLLGVEKIGRSIGVRGPCASRPLTLYQDNALRETFVEARMPGFEDAWAAVAGPNDWESVSPKAPTVIAERVSQDELAAFTPTHH
jgi:hypothetical protein